MHVVYYKMLIENEEEPVQKMKTNIGKNVSSYAILFFLSKIKNYSFRTLKLTIEILSNSKYFYGNGNLVLNSKFNHLFQMK